MAELLQISRLTVKKTKLMRKSGAAAHSKSNVGMQISDRVGAVVR
jgi:hypothetical protein